MNFYLFSYINSIEKKLRTNRSSQNGYQLYYSILEYSNITALDKPHLSKISRKIEKKKMDEFKASSN